ncbi:MarR family winged helix-turn-helix transcriptional regulator [Actinoplanes couchii]|uniref:MarR family transcriptional regulator n=1 Tax=Actinoplanes couchii TaxID=403638 RepID=A0ABQ3XDQ6_9ACTN|nr:MarR family transcriptional regulator [Actinoplanes couchii]MDR6317144.1 DNA-binding MarR family transcriptional regulator [Actinoplanes couchii]GID56638.1 MarR family transcriptional regulator [Actinoplanes couchii]
MTATPHASTPRWLTDTEMDTWTNLVQLLMLIPTALDQQLREEAGLPHTYYHILSALSGQPDHAMRMTELARQAGTTTTRLSHAVSTLEQRGWVGRRACRTDKRGQIAYLTEAGYAVLEAAAPGHVAEVRRLVFDHLTEDDVRRLGALSGKLLPTLTGNA